MPVWAIGWWRLARDPALATWRCFAVAYPLLALVFLVTGGKAYYLGGLYPVLLAAGSIVVYGWAAQHGRRPLVRGALLVSLLAAAYLFLPIVPAAEINAAGISEVNYDAGEQVGWPELASSVQTAYDDLSPADQAHSVVLTINYGEAGAVAKYAPDLPVYSGHNSLWDLGPPPTEASVVILVGGWYDAESAALFDRCEQAGVVTNDAGIDNDEDGTPIRVCHGLRASWSTLWPDLRALG